MKTIYRTSEGRQLVETRYREFLRHWSVSSRQFHVPTRQGDTFVIACGEESLPPVLLMHGSLANSAAWMGDVALWSKQHRVFAIDVIGEPGLSASSRPPLKSEAYVEWLDDVMNALGLTHASLVGVSLGGWLALDYATHRPDRIDRMALLCPGGIGRQKIAILLKVALFSLFGAWGKRKLREAILGKSPANISPAARAFGEFFALIHKHTKPRTGRLPVFSDASLKKLTMPMLVIVGAKDALLDSAETRRRICGLVEKAEVRYIENAGHFIPAQGPTIAEFLNRAAAQHLPVTHCCPAIVF